MKKLAILCVLVMTAYGAFATPTTDVYDFRMRVKVPRIYDNTASLGKRKWQTQLITGQMLVNYDTDDIAPVITFKNCVNLTHKINKKNVTYLCEQGYDEVVRRWVVMGNNKTGVFKDGSCFFFADFEPSYNIGDDEPDNSLLLYFGGYGTLQKVKTYLPCDCTCGESGTAYKVKNWKGYCVGTMGCGCRAYGHTSPTRVLGFCGPACDWVSDVAAIPMGQWQAKYRYSY